MGMKLVCTRWISISYDIDIN